MKELKESLKEAGCSKEEIEVAVQAIVNINGDHIEVYRSINTLCKAQDDLHHTRALIAQLDLGAPAQPAKRPYVRKPKEDKPSLIEKSGVAAASEALKEQVPVKSQSRKFVPKVKEMDEEIKANIEESGEVIDL
jgi:hypothetical protein